MESSNRLYKWFDYSLIIGLFLMVLTYFNGEIYRVFLWVFVPVGALGCTLIRKNICFNVYLKFLFFLFLWCTISWFFSGASEIAPLARLWGVYLFGVILAYLSSSKTYYKYLNYIYLLFFIVLWLYAKSNILTGENEIGKDARLGDAHLNANFFSYIFFFLTISVFYLGTIFKNNFYKRFFRILFLCLIPLCFYLSILTASRQILFIQVPLFIILLWIRYIKGASKAQKIISAILFVFLLYFSIDYVNEIYDNSLLKNRTAEIEGDSRIELMKESFDVGLQHPFFGVGAGNFQGYSSSGGFAHNSFLELFANNGVIAPILFLSMIIYFIVEQFKAIKRTGHNVNILFLTFGVFYIFANFFYVYYSNPWLMGYFIMVASFSLNYIDSEKLTRK